MVLDVVEGFAASSTLQQVEGGSHLADNNRVQSETGCGM